MQVAVRSYLIAGTAAVVGAGAIGLTPVLPGAVRPVDFALPTVANVALTSDSFSLADIVGLIGNSSLDGILTDLSGGVAGVVQGLLSTVGTAFIQEALPLLTAAAGDVARHLAATVAGLLSGPDSFGAQLREAAAGLPTVVTTAIGYFGSGDVQTGIQTLRDGLAAPAAVVGQVLAAVAADLQSYLATKVADLLSALPDVLGATFNNLLGFDAQPLIQQALKALSGFFPGVTPPAASVAAPAALALSVAPEVAAPAADVVADAPAAAPSAPRAAASVRAAAPTAEPGEKSAAEPAAQAATEAVTEAVTEPAAEAPAAPSETPAQPEAAEPQAVSDEPAAPVARGRSAAPHAAVAAQAGAEKASADAKPTRRGRH